MYSRRPLKPATLKLRLNDKLEELLYDGVNRIESVLVHAKKFDEMPLDDIAGDANELARAFTLLRGKGTVRECLYATQNWARRLVLRIDTLIGESNGR